jgi:hypothetical protein
VLNRCRRMIQLIALVMWMVASLCTPGDLHIGVQV